MSPSLGIMTSTGNRKRFSRLPKRSCPIIDNGDQKALKGMFSKDVAFEIDFVDGYEQMLDLYKGP